MFGYVNTFLYLCIVIIKQMSNNLKLPNYDYIRAEKRVHEAPFYRAP